MSTVRKTRLPIVYTLVLIEQWIAAGTFVAAKWALIDIDAVTLTVLRFIIATIGIWIVHLLWPGRQSLDRRDIPAILLLGAIGVALNQGLFLYGMKFTTPTHAALLYGALPVFVYLLAIVKLRERSAVQKWLGVLVAVGGVVVVITAKGVDLHPSQWRGDLLVLIAVVAWAVYTVWGRPLVQKYGAVHVTAYAMLGGLICYLPLGVPALLRFEPSAVEARAWLSLLYIALGTSVVAYTLWFWALARIEAAKLAIFNNLQPAFAAILAWGLYGEPLGAALIAGGVLVIVGVVLTETG